MSRAAARSRTPQRRREHRGSRPGCAGRPRARAHWRGPGRCRRIRRSRTARQRPGTAFGRSSSSSYPSENVEEEAEAHGRSPGENGDVARPDELARAAGILGGDGLADVAGVGPDPAHPAAQEEHEALLRAELEADRSGHEVMLDVAEQHPGAGAARETARVAVEVVAALDVEGRGDHPFEGDEARSAAYAEPGEVVVEGAVQTPDAVRTEHRGDAGAGGKSAVELQTEVTHVRQLVPMVRGSRREHVLRVGASGRGAKERAGEEQGNPRRHRRWLQTEEDCRE